MAFDLDEGAFLGFVVEAIIFGMYTILFVLAIIVLLGHPRGKAINYPLTITTFILYALCTAHIALNWDNKWKGLFTHKGTVSISNESPDLFADDTILSITNFVGELVLLYRCWIVWNKQWLVILFPATLSLTALGLVMSALGILNSIDPTAPIAPAEVLPLASASYIISLVLNILVTSLIIFKIMKVTRQSRHYHGGMANDRLLRMIEVIIESGALYVFIQIIFVVLFLLQNPAQNIVVAAAVQIYGIAPTLLIVRVRLGSTYFNSSTPYPQSIELTNSAAPHGVSVTVHTTRSTHVMSDVELELNRAHARRSLRGVHGVELPKDAEELSYGEGEGSPIEEKLGEA